jgi:hypothetical protein
MTTITKKRNTIVKRKTKYGKGKLNTSRTKSSGHILKHNKKTKHSGGWWWFGKNKKTATDIYESNYKLVEFASKQLIIAHNARIPDDSCSNYEKKSIKRSLNIAIDKIIIYIKQIKIKNINNTNKTYKFNNTYIFSNNSVLNKTYKVQLNIKTQDLYKKLIDPNIPNNDKVLEIQNYLIDQSKVILPTIVSVDFQNLENFNNKDAEQLENLYESLQKDKENYNSNHISYLIQFLKYNPYAIKDRENLSIEKEEHYKMNNITDSECIKLSNLIKENLDK